jgi:hypothetical protein
VQGVAAKAAAAGGVVVVVMARESLEMRSKLDCSECGCRVARGPAPATAIPRLDSGLVNRHPIVSTPRIGHTTVVPQVNTQLEYRWKQLKQ